MASEDTTALHDLATRPVGRLLWNYSLPAIVGMVVMQLYHVVDRALIGHYGGIDGQSGTDAMAGLTITFPLMNLTTAIGVLVGAGASALVSIMLGQGRASQARQVLGQALTLTVLFGALYIAFFSLYMDDMLRLFGATERSLPYARTFMTWILPGLFLMNITFSFNNVMRASGHAVRAMVTMLLGAVLNTLLATLFVYFLGWGIKGAAVASDISMAVTGIFVMSHFMRRDITVRLTRGIYRLQASTVWRILGVGAAPAIVNAAACLVNIFINNNLARLGGEQAIAAAGVFVTYASVLVSVIIGLCQGMQPVAGYNYGAGNTRRVMRAYWLTVAAATAVAAAGWAGSLLWPRSVSAVLLGDPAVGEYAAGALTVSMAMFWMAGFQIVSTNFLQSIGKISISIVLSLTRQVIFLLPILYWMVHTRGLQGIWLSFPASDVCATVVAALCIAFELRRLRRASFPAPLSTHDNITT